VASYEVRLWDVDIYEAEPKPGEKEQNRENDKVVDVLRLELTTGQLRYNDSKDEIYQAEWYHGPGLDEDL
jgi:hypothetical protein